METRSSLQHLVRDKLGKAKFVVVSNREPYMHRYKGKQIEWVVPVSGLVTALDPITSATGGSWIAYGSGDADQAVVDHKARVRVPPDNPSYTLRRIWLTQKQVEGYYYGFANEALWPLCHLAFTRPIFNSDHWKIYHEVNQIFADAVAEEIQDQPAVIFIQDYHFALLPKMIKERAPQAVIAQFWHIPWPNREAFQICPWGEELLEGMLGNDLLGFHIPYHSNNFLETVDRTLESKVDREHFSITKGGHETLVRAFPISVDFKAITNEASSAAMKTEIVELKKALGLENVPYIGLGVDRVDYTKGILERLEAVERFLEQNPQYVQKMTFLQIASPSRTHIDQYKATNDEIKTLVDKINTRFKKGSWKPILYLREYYPQKALRAFYRMAHFCVVSSLHDGMNLVAKEFVASRPDEDGVLILSQFTGAARELSEALFINPYAVDEFAQTIHQAIEMPAQERKKRMATLRHVIREANIYTWAWNVIHELARLKPEAGKGSQK